MISILTLTYVIVREGYASGTWIMVVRAKNGIQSDEVNHVIKQIVFERERIKRVSHFSFST